MSWKQYGGIKHLETNTNIRVNNIVSDSLILTSQISGDYNINGNLFVSQHSILNDVSFNGKISFNGDVDINGNLVSSRSIFDEHVLFIKTAHFGQDISNSSYFAGYNNNIGLNNLTPIATFDISSDKVSALIVKSNLPYTKNIISQNINGKGISVATSDVSSCIEFYNDNSVNGSSNAKIKYNNNGILEIDVSNNTEFLSNVSIGSRDNMTHVLNESLAVYDNSAGIYFEDVYNNPTSITGNAASFIANDNSSNAFLNIITSDGKGARFGGGAYPSDTSRAMNTFGIIKDANYIPSHTIVSGNNPTKYKTTTGINTFKPKVDNYALDINGPLHIENGDITLIYDVSFQILAMNGMKSNRMHIAAVGSSTDISGSNNILNENFYRKYFIYSNDGGIHWNNVNITGFFNVELQKVANNINDIFLYDSSSCFIVGDKQAFLYSNDGYNTFYRIAYPVNTNITNVYVSDLFPTTWRVWFASSNATLSYFDMSKNTIGNIAPNVSINNLSDNVKRLDGYGNYIYYSYGNVIVKRDINNNNIIPLAPIYKIFNHIYVLDENHVIGVGENNISTTYDGGNSWVHTSLSGSFYKAYSIDVSNSIVIDNNYNLYYGINDVWNSVSYNTLNSNGMGDTITNPDNHFSSVLMTNIDSILLANTKTYYNYINQYGASNLFYMFLPNLFNRINNHVIDISGNMKVSGDIHINENGELKSTNSTFNLLNRNVNEINIGGDSTSIVIGNANGGNTYIQHHLDVSGNISGYSDIDICGNLFIHGVSSFNGDVSMNDNLFVANTVSMGSGLYVNEESILNGDVSMNGKLGINGDVSMNGNLGINGDVSMNADLYVNGYSILNQDVSINDNLFVGGDVSLNSRLYVNGHSSLNGDVSLNSVLQVDSSSVFNGDVYVNSNIYLNNDVVLNSDLFVNHISTLNGDVSMNSNLFVGRDVSMNAGLYLNGASILNGDVSINSNLFVGRDVSLNSDLYVNQTSMLNGDVFMNRNLFVYDDVSLNSDLYVDKISILNGDVYMNSDLFVSKDISFDANLFVNQMSTLNGDVSMNSNLFVADDVSLNSDLYVNQISRFNGDVFMNSNLFVTDDVSFNSDLYVNQKSTFNGDVSMNSNLFVSQDVSLNSDLYVNQISTLNGDVYMNSKLFVTNDVSLNSDLYVNQKSIMNGDVSLNSNLFVLRDVSLNSDLYVNQRSIMNGDVSLNSNLFVSRDISVNSNLFVNQKSTFNGDVSLNSNLFVSRDASFNSKLFVNQISTLNGDASLNSNLFVGRDVSLNSNLYVNQKSTMNGDVSLNSKLYVNQNSTLNGDVSLNSNLYVNQKSILNGDVSLNSNLFVLRDVSLNSNLYVNQKSNFNDDVSMNTNLFVGRDASFNSNLYVNQNSILNGDVIMNNNLNVLNTLSCNNINISGNLVLNDIETIGKLYVNNTAVFNDDASFNDIVEFNGVVNINARLNSTNDISLNGNLYVGGNTILNNMNITGFTILNNTAIDGNLRIFKNCVIGNNAQEAFTVKLTDPNGSYVTNPEINFKAITHFQGTMFIDTDVNIYSGIVVDVNSVSISKPMSCSASSSFSGAFSLSNSGFDTDITSKSIALAGPVGGISLSTTAGNISLSSTAGNILLSGRVVMSGQVNLTGVLNAGIVNITSNALMTNVYGTNYTAVNTNSGSASVGFGTNASIISIGSLGDSTVDGINNTRNEIRIGNYKQLGASINSSRIIIGGPNDFVDFYTTPTIISTVTPIYQTPAFVLNSGPGKTATSGNSGIFISDNTPLDISENKVGYFAVSNDMKGWNLKAPFGTSFTNTVSNVVGIRVNELVNPSGINNGLLKLTAGTTGIDGQGSNFNITSANMDISNVFIKNIDTTINVQSVSTDVSMNGNLFVSNVCIGTDNSNNYSNSLQINGNIYQTTTYSNGFILQF